MTAERPVLPTAAEISKERDAILGSFAFARADKQKQLLNYVLDKFLSGKTDELTEYHVAYELFQRGGDYNPSQDSIVRVNAHELRRRLAEYYSKEGKDRPIRIVFPRGSYCPTFEINRDSSALAPGQVKYGAVRLRRTFILIGVFLVASLTANLVLLLKPVSPPKEATQYSFYPTLLGLDRTRDRPSLIALSNPNVILPIAKTEDLPMPADRYVEIETGGPFSRLLEDSRADLQEGFTRFYLRPSPLSYTGMGEAFCAYQIGQIFRELDLPAELTQARFLSWDVASKHNVVILGHPRMNDWTRQYLQTGAFQISQYQGVVNRSPAPGEERLYAPKRDSSTGQPVIDYGLITVFTLPTDSRVIVLAGISSAGTWGTGSFFCDSGQMKPVFERLRSMSTQGRFPRDYQILIRTDIRDHIPVRSSFVAARVLREQMNHEAGGAKESPEQ